MSLGIAICSMMSSNNYEADEIIDKDEEEFFDITEVDQYYSPSSGSGFELVTIHRN